MSEVFTSVTSCMKGIAFFSITVRTFVYAAGPKARSSVLFGCNSGAPTTVLLPIPGAISHVFRSLLREISVKKYHRFVGSFRAVMQYQYLRKKKGMKRKIKEEKEKRRRRKKRR